MRKKRVTLKYIGELIHSIPISLSNFINNKLVRLSSTNTHITKFRLKLSNNKLRYISYSIPLTSIVALLLVFSMTTSPDLQTLFFVSDSNSVYAIDDNNSSLDLSTDSNNDGNDNNSDESNGNDADIALLEDNPSSASITIAGQGKDEVVVVAPGTTGYRSHDITISVSKAKDYSLTISGPSEMSMPAGANIPITGANGATGDGMDYNHWGYYWGDTNASSDNTPNGNRIYNSVMSTGTNLAVPKLGSNDSNSVNTSSNNAINFTRKLIFAAKFSNTVTVGNYTAPVTLSLAVTPEETGNFWTNETGIGHTAYDAGTTSMQGISEGFCKGNDNIKTGWTVKLNDLRDKLSDGSYKSYTVVKLKDGRCWMQENLNLTGPKTLTTADTDNPKDGSWPLPTSVTKWNTSDKNIQQVKTGTTSLSGWKQGYGNYYSWCAATAGTCTDSGKAPGSICPRNWHLPSGGATGEFQTLFGANGANLPGANNPSKFNAVQTDPYKFPPAGHIGAAEGTISGGNGSAYYWSSTAVDSTNASYLSFSENTFNPASNGLKFAGMPIRCISNY